MSMLKRLVLLGLGWSGSGAAGLVVNVIGAMDRRRPFARVLLVLPSARGSSVDVVVVGILLTLTLLRSIMLLRLGRPNGLSNIFVDGNRICSERISAGIEIGYGKPDVFFYLSCARAVKGRGGERQKKRRRMKKKKRERGKEKKKKEKE